MKKFSGLNNFYKYVICVVIVLFILYIIMFFLEKDYKSKNNTIEMSNINFNNDKYTINVNYPKFKNDNLNKALTDWLYDYIKKFKEKAENDELKINYHLYNINDNYVNVFFDIDDSLNINNERKSIVLDIKNNKLSNISEVFEEEELRKNIDLVSKKYSSKISEKILTSDINIFNYLIDDDGMTIYFDNIEYESISYTPYLSVSNDKKVSYEIDKNKKMVALTFDDGPSKYSLEILECLLLNDSKATFFELGNRMKNNKAITKKLYDSNMEIGNHTYSHKYLTRISESEALSEINSTSILFNEITNDNINLLRAPYGSVNSEVRKLSPFPIILWSIDTKDWLYKDPIKSSNIVFDNVSDGDIILMHDVHYETIELAKIVIPELKARGFEILSVSELAKYKNKKLENGVVVRKIN